MDGNRVQPLDEHFADFQFIVHHLLIDLGMPMNMINTLFHFGQGQPFQPLSDLVKQNHA